MAKKTTAKKPKVIKGLEHHRQKWRWRTMFQGRRLTFPLKATTELEAIVEVMELKKNPAIYEMGAWTAEANAYIAQGRATNRISEKNGYNRLSAILSAGKAMGVSSARQVTPAMVSNWLAAEIERLPADSTSPGTYLRHLRAFFKHLLQHGKISQDPTNGLEANRASRNLRDVFIPAEDLRKLLDAAREEGDRDLEFILVLGAECGMRRNEISSCTPEWFDLKTGCVTVPVLDGRFKRKGQEGRKKPATVPLSEPVLELITRQALPAPFVIAPTKAWGKNIYRFEFKKRLKNFLVRHGWGHVTIHDLRRSFGSNRVSAGVSIEKVANWMGIDPATAWRHYARFIPADAEINRGAALKAVTEAPEAAVVASSGSLKERLARVEDLHAAGLISDAERAGKRAEILATL